MSKPRSLCFTLNNYTLEELQHIKTNAGLGYFKYLVAQEERGAAGTPHIQGYAQRASPTTLTMWKSLLGSRIHGEASKGTAQQNKVYCTKDADRIPGTLIIEEGEIPQPGERKDLRALVEAAKNPDQSIVDIIEGHGEQFIRYHRGITAIRTAYATPRDFKTRVYWFYGSTGSGKTRTIAQVAPGAYWKQNSPWWCGYDPQSHSDVVIDEFRGDFSKFSFLLSLFDRYPLQVQYKGGNCNFRARRIFVSSPNPPLSTWESRNEGDLHQLYRRIEVIVEFLAGGFKRLIKGEQSDFDLIDVVPPFVSGSSVAAAENSATAEEPGPSSPPRQRSRIDTFNI